ncbi:MAG: hypothetical protein VKK97_09660 [Synechococcaceae cyanobacterium]|nr:hypothetical protein [Synechococcaceae cyanobacterium]
MPVSHTSARCPRQQPCPYIEPHEAVILYEHRDLFSNMDLILAQNLLHSCALSRAFSPITTSRFD